ncbi:MAG: Na(+)-translocating NADH-quinone reductase subunit A [Gammaproteobacteria bacterium]
MLINLRKGLNIPIQGEAGGGIERGPAVKSVALIGTDYTGLKPRMLVEQGAKVTVGQPLFVDKRDPDVFYTSPAAGTVVLINRGARRVLQSVVVELDEEQPECRDFSVLAEADPASMSAEEIAGPLCKSGLWSAFRTRPFNKVPLSGTQPDAIFVTAIDTQPLAADPAIVVSQNADAFASGLEVISRLTSGKVHLCTVPEWQGPVPECALHSDFSGPHPAGLPGTHIHYLHPVSSDRMVWHIGYQDVIAIGMLFTEGRLSLDRVVALGGPGFKKPRLISTKLGASIEDLTKDAMIAESALRIISGSALDGHKATGPAAWLSRYHLQVTALTEHRKRSLFGWFRSGGYSFAGRLSSNTPAPDGQSVTTARYGRPTAMLPIDAFDKVMPLNMLPVPLLKALLIKDTDQAQLLGCLELAPEDLALCTFVCPGKNDYGFVLQENLRQIEKDG